MKLRIEAAPGEIQEKSLDLLKALAEAVDYSLPELSEILLKAEKVGEKEIPPVLAELQKKTEKGYAEMVKHMLADVNRVLMREDAEKSEEIEDDLNKSLFIGPRGGWWADAAHTIPYNRKKHGPQVGLNLEMHGREEETPQQELNLPKRKQVENKTGNILEQQAEKKEKEQVAAKPKLKRKKKAEPEEIPEERYDAEKAREILVRMGDDLYSDQAMNPYEVDNSGFNRIDMGRWHSVVEFGEINDLRAILKKYKRQLIGGWGDDYYKTGLADPENYKARVVPEINRTFGSLSLPVSGRIDRKKFKDYVALQKEYGARFDGRKKAWYIPKTDLEDFNFSEYQSEMEELGIDVEEPEGLTFDDKGHIEPPKAPDISELSAQDIRAGIADRTVNNAVAVIRGDDGKFSFYAPYDTSGKFNKLFSNKSGMLTGVTKYNPENYARETYDLDLAEEAIEKLRALKPDWKIVTSGVKEARIEKDQYLAELQKPIPEVQKKLNPQFKLFPYQNEAVRFLDETGGNALIGDEMGLGKTLETLAWAAKNDKKILVVCPKVVRRTWLQEAEKFFPDHFHGMELVSKDLRSKKKNIDLTDLNIATVNFESIAKFEEKIKEGKFDAIIVDESHRMKNPKAKVTKTIFRIGKDFDHKILLSGTAIKNKRDELVSQLDFIAPDKYTHEIHGVTDYGHSYTKKTLKENTIGGLWLELRGIYLARLKSVVLKDLPEKTTSIMEQEVKGLPDIESGDIGEFSRLKDQIAQGKVGATLDSTSCPFSS